MRSVAVASRSSSRDQRAHRVETRVERLAGIGAVLDGDVGAVRDRVEGRPAADERGHERELHGVQEPAEMVDGVVAFVRPGGVGGAAAELDLDDAEAAVGARELQPGRLGDDARGGQACAEVLDHGEGAEAVVLLVGDQREHDVGLRDGFGRHDAGGDAGLHVAGAAAVHPAGLDPGHEGIDHAADADGVEMAVEGEQRAVRHPARRDQARAVLRADDLDREALRLEACGQQLDRGTLTGRTGHQTRVDRVERDELARELDLR